MLSERIITTQKDAFRRFMSNVIGSGRGLGWVRPFSTWEPMGSLLTHHLVPAIGTFS